MLFIFSFSLSLFLVQYSRLTDISFFFFRTAASLPLLFAPAVSFSILHWRIQQVEPLPSPSPSPSFSHFGSSFQLTNLKSQRNPPFSLVHCRIQLLRHGQLFCPPTSAHLPYNPDPSQTAVLQSCRDGYPRWFCPRRRGGTKGIYPGTTTVTTTTTTKRPHRITLPPPSSPYRQTCLAGTSSPPQPNAEQQ